MMIPSVGMVAKALLVLPLVTGLGDAGFTPHPGPVVINEGQQIAPFEVADRQECCEKTFLTTSVSNVTQMFAVNFNMSTNTCIVSTPDAFNFASLGLYTKNSDTCTWTMKSGGTLVYDNCNSQSDIPLVFIASKNHTIRPYICNKDCTYQESLNINIPESQSVGEDLLEIKLCDDEPSPEGDSLSIVNTSASSLVRLRQNGNKFFIVLNSTVDYDNMTSKDFKFTLEAFNGDNTNTSTLNIHFLDVDDLPPKFSKDFYTCDIPEGTYGAQNRLPNCTVVAHDQDEGIDDTIQYEITSVSANAAQFDINGDGHLGLDGTLDRETLSLYYLRIKATEKNNTAHFAETFVVINVTDVDDNAPVIQQTIYNVSIAENSPAGTVVAYVSATDADIGENAKIAYSLEDNAGVFSINSSTGIVQVVKAEQTDREQQQKFTLKVFAQSSDARKSNASQLYIWLEDENDNSPNFTVPSLEISINKTHQHGRVGEVSAKDPDQYSNGEVVYSLIGQGSSSLFIVDNKTGNIFLTGSLSETFEPTYNFSIKAEDQALYVTKRRSSVLPVTIIVHDVNIHRPVFHGFPDNISIAEDTLPGTILFTLNITDADPTAKLSAEIQPVGLKTLFTIDNQKVILHGSLDRETNSSFQVTVHVSDGIHSVKNVTRVTVLDVNDNSPEFVKSNYTFAIGEEQKEVITLGTLSATDKDADQNGNLTYIIDEHSNWTSNFTIDQYSGELKTVPTLDREALAIPDTPLTFVVYAKDGGMPSRTGTTVVLINIIDVNDHPPTFVGEVPAELSFDELTTPGSFLKIRATDPDHGDNAKIVYKLVSSASDVVTINVSSGELSITQPLVINDCKNTSIDLHVTACNTASPANCTDPKHITIQIQDVNDHTPTITLNSPIKANEGASFNITLSRRKVIADDKDCLPCNKNIFYWVDDPSDTIYFNHTAMNFYAIRDIDADPPQNDSHFNIMLYASNDPYNTSAASSLNVTIKVGNTPDSMYHFDEGFYSVNISENTKKMDCFFRLNATYTDVETNAPTKEYKLLEQEPSYGMFSVDARGCINLQGILDFENETQRIFHLNISLTTRRFIKTIGSDSCEVKIYVTNVNDNRPVFSANNYTFEIAENNLAHTLVGQVSATDLDGDPLHYSIQDSQPYFNISSSTGLIEALVPIDYENITSPLMFNVTVTDAQHSVTSLVEVTVHPLNDNTPVFTNQSYIWSIIENMRHDFPVYATDADANSNPAILDGTIQYMANVPKLFQENITINNQTGMFHVGPFDREVLGQSGLVQFTVLAVDSGMPSRTGVAMVTINVTSTNDNVPVYWPEVVNMTIYLEEGQAYSNITQSYATDADIGEGSDIVYTIASGQKGPFTVDSGTGVLSTNGALWIDSVNNGTYDVVIEASNPAPIVGQQHSTMKGVAKQYINIILMDINNNAPVYNNNTHFANISECTPTGSIILSVHAVDEDTSTAYNTVTYWTEGNSSTQYHVDGTTGNLTLIRPLDVDQPNSSATITFKVYATDLSTRDPSSNHSVSTSVTVHVTNCNDNAPSFTKDIYQCAVVIGEDTTQFNCSVAADDKDGDPVQYSLVKKHNMADSQWFDIDSDTGIISSTKKIYTNSSIAYKSLLYKVVSNDTQHTGEAVLVISVEDLNDNPPVFAYPLYNISINESLPAGSPLNIEILATDPDSMDMDRLVYSIHSKGKIFPAALGINNSSGRLYLLRTLDYEQIRPKKFDVTIMVTDTANHTAKTELHVTVLDVNDNTPVFGQSEYVFTLPEGETVLGQNFSVNATDEDTGENRHITYNITVVDDEDKQNFFNITQQGHIQIVKPLDREDPSAVHQNGSAVYTLIVTAKDHGQPPLSSTAKVQIKVTDINDCVPTFSSSNYTVSMEEGSAIGLTIASVTASDCDYDPAFNNVTYSQLSGDFNVTSTGDVLVNRYLAFEEGNNVHRVQVVASDGQSETKANIAIHVLDTNDHSPQFTNLDHLYRFTINENKDVGKDGVAIGNLTADDADFGLNGQVVYTITSGNVNDIFHLKNVNKTCVIWVNNGLDYEEANEYRLDITASDSAPIGNRSTTTTVVVQVLDENDNKPQFEVDLYQTNVVENVKSGTILDLIPVPRVTDADSSWYGIEGFRYSLDNDTGIFQIDSMNGSITVNDSSRIDREKTHYFFIEMIVKDTNGTGLNGTSRINVTVLGVNDNPPVFSADTYQFNVTESAEGLTPVGNVSASDPDIGVGKSITYAIARQSEQHPRFIINEESGTIEVAGLLDREDVTEYNLNVSVTDGQHYDYTEVIIRVLDVNDNAPQILGINIVNVINVEVVEEQVAGPLYTVRAEDADENRTDNSWISFSIPDNLNHSFYISEDNGTIFTTRPLDREKVQSYQINVTATDHGSPQQGSFAIINVTVLDINDNSPSFYMESNESIAMSEVYIVEKSPVGSPVGVLRAEDPDKGLNGTVEFEFQPSEASRYFSIDRVTGLVMITERISISDLVDESLVNGNDTDNATLVLEVVAHDKGPERSNTSLKFFVHIEKVNDNAPVFDRQLFSFNMTEEQPAGAYVGECSATIPNATNPRMSLSLNNEETFSFQINTTSGQLLTTARIDREEQARYVFSVQVKDGRTPERTAFALVEVLVEDINDNAPEFVNDNLTLTVMEETWTYETVPVTATDRDSGLNAEIIYTLADQDDGIPVLIDPTSGVLTINGSFDRENTSSYDIKVIATDQGQPYNMSTSTTIHLTVLDVNDHPPQFHGLLKHYNVSETASNEEIFTVNTTDEDSGWNARVIYSLISTDGGPFDIDPFNGSLLVNGPLDYEVKPSYLVIIEARDEGTEPMSSSATVYIDVIDTYDFQPHFSKDVYEVNVQWNTPNLTAILDLNASDSMVTYSLSRSDPAVFSIDAASGVIYLQGKLDRHDNDVFVHVSATDRKNQTATCLVIVHIGGHYAAFPQRDYNVALPENIVAGVIIDLNTTEELAGKNITYSIDSIQPNVQGLFNITEKGVLSCLQRLDREVHDQYVLYISATVVGSHRSKRSVDETSNVIRLVIDVVDKNDNPPVFPSNQQLVFWVPYTARANYVVTQLKAEDEDTALGSEIRYNITEGSTDVFDIDHVTGKLRTLVAIASTHKESFDVHVVAYDTSFETDLNITIGVIQRSKQVLLTASIPLQEFRLKESVLIHNMSSILGVLVEVETVQPHLTEDTPQRLDLAKIDIMFHAVNRTTGRVLSSDNLLRLMNTKNKELSDLFLYNAAEVKKEKTVYDPSAITATQIGLICIAIFILFGSAIALIIAMNSSSKYEQECQEIRKLLKENEHRELELQLDSLRSRHSSKLSAGRTMAITAFNRGYEETEFNSSEPKDQTEIKHKEPVALEDQEVQMDFDEEPFDGNLPQAIAPPNAAAIASVVDSGVGNTTADSIIASSEVDIASNVRSSDGSNNLRVPGGSDDDRPVMTSSPRLPRSDEDSHAQGLVNITAVNRSRDEGSICLIDVVETETNDDDDEEQEEEGHKVESDNEIHETEDDNVVLRIADDDRNDRSEVESTSL